MKKVMLILFSVNLLLSSIYADTIKVKVSENIEIYKKSIVQVPSTHYKEVQVQVPYPCKNTDKNSIGFDTVTGAIIGVVIGNQIGHGTGRDVAKIVGGLSGGYIANQNRKGNTCYRMEFRQKPITTYGENIRERLIGYKNCGYIGNKKICKRSKYKQKYIWMSY